MIGKGLLVGCRALSAGSLYRMKGLREGGSSSPGGLAALMMRADAVHGRGPRRVRESACALSALVRRHRWNSVDAREVSQWLHGL